jgi:hypothetical protein
MTVEDKGCAGLASAGRDCGAPGAASGAGAGGWTGTTAVAAVGPEVALSDITLSSHTILQGLRKYCARQKGLFSRQTLPGICGNEYRPAVITGSFPPG